MTEETPAIIPQAEPLAPPPETIVQEEDTRELPRDLDNPDDTPEVEAAPVDDDEEYELDGKKFRAPKALKDRMLQHADYTKKTQEVSAKAKELDAREAAMPKLAEDEMETRVKLAGVKSQLADYQKLTKADWDAHFEADFVETSKHAREFERLKAEEAALNTELTNKQTERSQVAERDLANRVEETNKFAAANIKGYTPELTGKIVEFATTSGVSEKVLKELWSPQMYTILHQAMLGAQVLKQQAAPRKEPSPPPEPLKVVRHGGNPAPQRSLAELAEKDDLTDFMAARKAGRGGR